MPGPPYIAGRQGARQVAVNTIWSRVNGEEFERRWWGPFSAVAALQYQARIGATSVELIQQPGSAIGILVARYAASQSPSSDAAVETVEISFKDETVPINRNPNFIDIANEDILQMEEDLKNHVENPNSVGTAEYDYYEIRSRETTSYRVKLPVVTWTRTVGVGYNSALDLNNVGAVFSTEDLVDSIGAPVLFSVPTGNVGVSANSADTIVPGWLKDARVEYTSDGKIQLVLIGEYGLWERDLYIFAS